MVQMAGMAFLDRISVSQGRDIPDAYPFNLPVIESLDSIQFDPRVTFFVGENGSGKSSLLEAIAVGMNCPAVGASDVQTDPMLEDARQLAGFLTFRRSVNARLKMFFRAEDAIGFTRRVQTDMHMLHGLIGEFDVSLTGEGRDRAMNMAKAQIAAYETRYGENPHARSHGEWFIELLKSRLNPNGLYILDEPETPLSPVHQLSLLSLIMQQLEHNCQFIIATHSPILMALPKATILHFDQVIQPIEWDEVEHVDVTRAFLNDPESFIRHL